MKKLIPIFIFTISVLFGCKSKVADGTFVVNGNLKNVENQKVFLDQMFFSPDKNPEVLDTAEIKEGKFLLSAIGNEDGLYRIRLEKQDVGYVFINDKSEINFNADVNDTNLSAPNFNTPANKAFYTFLTTVDNKQKGFNNLSAEIEKLKKEKKNDSIVKSNIEQLNNDANSFKNYIVKTIDTASNPVVAIFALGYTRGINPDELNTVVPNLAKRFPAHGGVASIIKSYNDMMAKNEEPKVAPAETPTGTTKPGVQAVGNMAPDFTMADVDGKPVTLSSLKGKYVLVDFWASWCGPCRGENPNVVANYNKYKNKNFTVLGVSLDQDKAAWLAAIKADKLTWKHVSDLKYWDNAAARLYGVNSIPYNILIDPTGKIIATSLTGGVLGKKLGEVLGK